MDLIGYKYSMKEHAESMIQKGEIYIGTGYEYRKYDDDQIKDLEEFLGYRSTVFNDTYSDDNPIPSSMAGGIVLGKGATAEVVNYTVRLSRQLPNTYMYCLTNSPSEEVMRRFKYDTCIEIHDLEEFALIIRDFLWTKGHIRLKNYAHCNCSYTGRELSRGEHPDNIYWKKDPRFSPQAEKRFVWRTLYPKNKLEKGQVFTIPELKNLVRIHNF